ncbi:uncharacterized protein TNCV_4927931 [Trichonephila clavipes]|nr:uncharacterized protein TNCV_4927931 [Trichonephila clavipes]
MGCHCLQYTVTLSIDLWHHDILQPHVLPFMQRLPGAVFQQDNARPPHCYYPSLACPIARFVCNRAYLGSFGMASWVSHEFERTRGKITANMDI